MPIKLSELMLRGSAVMPDDDTVLEIGGVIDETRKVQFADLNGLTHVISSAAGDTTQSVTVTYRDVAGDKLTEAKTLNGVTPVNFVATMERLLKAIKSATTAGDVAVEAQTATRANTAAAGSTADTIVLDAGASAVDDFYNGEVIRTTGGTGPNQIREIIDYVGATQTATVSRAWAVTPDATTTFRIAKGFFCDKAPVEVMEVRRIFFDSGADVPGGSPKTYYDKVFFINKHATLTLSDADILEGADPSGFVTFGTDAATDASTTNGAGNNRQVAPGAITFDNAAKPVPGDNLVAGERIGVWLKLSLAAGTAAQKTTYSPQLQGVTV